MDERKETDQELAKSGGELEFQGKWNVNSEYIAFAFYFNKNASGEDVPMKWAVYRDLDTVWKGEIDMDKLIEALKKVAK